MALWTEGGRVRYSGAARVVDPLLPDIARFKPALLELLERNQTGRLELARAVLASKRPSRGTLGGGGFDFGKLRPHWRAVNELEGRVFDSPSLAAWARGVCAQDEPAKTGI